MSIEDFHKAACEVAAKHGIGSHNVNVELSLGFGLNPKTVHSISLISDDLKVVTGSYENVDDAIAMFNSKIFIRLGEQKEVSNV